MVIGHNPGKHPNDADRIVSGEAVSRELTLSHYENFTVAARFLPSRLRQDLFNIYAFCRLADDFADECFDETIAESSLRRWEALLIEAASGTVSNPLFNALGDTIRRRRLSLCLFQDILAAFRLDLHKKRYLNWNELREYTRLSADPVGRIVLELNDFRNPDFFALSDNICTALQLVNHVQDVYEDWQRGRIYLPQQDMITFAVSEENIDKRQATDNFKRLLKFETERTRQLFKAGFPLLRKVSRKLAPQLALYWGGGMAAVRAIERVDYDVLNCSTKLNRLDKLKVVIKALRWFL